MGIGEEYLDENVCLHEDVSVSDIICHCSYIEVRVVCDNCGKGQTQRYYVESLIDNLTIRWDE
jgi:hypothetical protein